MGMGLIASLIWVILIFMGIVGAIMVIWGLGEDVKGCLIGIALLAPIVIGLYCGSQLETEQKMDYSYNIYALQDGSTIHGRRYYIEENSMYYYLADYKDGKKQYSVNCSESYIVEDANVTPHIEVVKNEYINIGSVGKFFYGADDGRTEYKIVVPQRTLTTDFNVDLQK